MSDTPNVSFEVTLSEASIDRLAARLAEVISDGLGEGFHRAFREFNENTRRMERTFTEASQQMARQFGRAFSGTRGALRNLENDVDAVSAAVLRGSEAFRQAGFEQQERIGQTARASRRERALEISRRDELVQLEKQKTTILEAEGKKQAIEAQRVGQLQVVAARNAGKQRILITQEVLRTIGRLERAFGATVAGIARTTVSAFSSMFSGLGRLIRRNNDQFSTGLRNSLSVRESTMRRSFSEQERLLRTHVTRQSAQLQQLNNRTQSGLIGFANRRNLFGGLLGGIAAGSLLVSTFTIGADFTRGLAVLEAQLGLTKEQMAGVRAEAIALGNDITLPGVSALDAAQAIQLLSKQFAQLGPAAITAAQDAAKGTLQLARAANVSAEEAAGIVGSSVNVFGIAASQATAVADQVTAALKNAAGVGFGDFSDAFKQGAAVFAQFQVPAVGATEALTEFNTALAVIARSGVVGSDAGTSLKQFFLQANRNAADAVTVMKEVTQRAGEAGTAFFDAAGNARPFAETLDILRRGLQGMTDEQRSNTLQTLFGSDAIRVANALLGVSTEEYAKVTQALREQGLAAKIAAAQNTGLKGALDAALSVFQTIQILLFEQVNVALGNFVLQLTSVANTILFGAGPALELLRQGLLGAAIGMGAILAARGAVEVIQLIGVAARFAIGPFGALVIAAGLVGAALNVMLQRSPELRASFELLGARLAELGTKIADELAPVFQRVGNFIDDTLIPALDRAAKFLADNLVPAFDAFVSWVQSTGIPAVVDFAQTLAGLAVDGFQVVAAAARSFATTVLPFIQPTIDGFTQLGSAIVDALGGNLSTLGSGARAAVTGLAQTLALVGVAIFEALRPVGERLVTFFQSVFTGDNLKKILSGVLVVVEEIGRILGSIVTNPILLRAILGVAAIAAAIAFRFLRGFVRGVADHADEIVALVGELLELAFKTALDHIELVFIAGLAAFLIGPRVIALFRAFGTQGGTAAGTSFLTAFRAKGAEFQQFFSGLFGMTPGMRAALQERARALDAFSGVGSASRSAQFFQQQLRDVQSINNELRILGSARRVDVLNPTAIKAARDEVQRLRGAISDTQLAGLQTRDTFRQWGSALAGVTAGVARVGTGILTAILTPFNTGQAKEGIVSGWARIMESLRALSANTGLSAGQLFGQAFKAAASLALGAATGFIAGRAEGQSGGSGVTSALLTGLGIAAVGGFTPGAIGVGAVAAGASLIGAAFGRSQKAAADAKRAYEELASEIRGVLIPAFEDGKLAALDFATAIADTDTRQDLTEIFVSKLPKTAKELLDRTGLSPKKILDEFAASGFDGVAALFGFDEFGSAFERQIILGQLEKVLNDMRDAIDEAALDERLLGFGDPASGQLPIDDLLFRQRRRQNVTIAPPDLTAWQTALEAAGVNVDTLEQKLRDTQAASDELFNISGNTTFQQTLDTLTIAGASAAQQIQTAFGNFNSLTNPQVRTAVTSLQNDFGNALRQGIADGLITDQSSAEAALLPIRDALISTLDPNAPGYQAAVDTLNTAFNNALTGVAPQIDAVQAATEAAEFAAEVQRVLEENPGIMPIQAQVTVQRNQARSELEQDAGGRQALANGILDELFPMPDASAVQAQFDALTQGVTDGIVGSLTAPENVSRVGTASSDLAGQVDTQFRTRLQISSPSRVMFLNGLQIARGLAQGISAGRSLVINAAISLARSAINAVQDSLAITSPSKVMFAMGANISEGMALGISSRAGMVADASAQLAAIARVGSDVTVTAPNTRFPDRARRGSAGGFGGGGDIDVVALGRAIAAEVKPDVHIDMPVTNRADSHAVASDVAWRLTSV